MHWKKFDWIDMKFEDFETVEGETRYYKVDGDLLPSMTSLLQQLNDGGIDAWRRRVGEEEADRIVAEAVARGNSLHDLSERYLKNELNRADVKGPGAVLFNRSRPILDELGPVVTIEAALYSKTHNYAGRVDCIAFHGKDLCIVDHKNSRNAIDLRKSYARKKLFSYSIQTAGYARAFGEMFPHLPKPTHGMLIVASFNDMTSTKFKFPLAPLDKELDIVIDAYHNGGDIKESMFFKL